MEGINITETKTVNKKIVQDEVHLMGGASGERYARVSFVVLDANTGERLDTLYVDYVGEDYNKFWDNFNSGAYLYQELVVKEGIEENLPEAIEATFKNEVAVVEDKIDNVKVE